MITAAQMLALHYSDDAMFHRNPRDMRQVIIPQPEGGGIGWLLCATALFIAQA
jgi:hypothetical protein